MWTLSNGVFIEDNTFNLKDISFVKNNVFIVKDFINELKTLNNMKKKVPFRTIYNFSQNPKQLLNFEEYEKRKLNLINYVSKIGIKIDNEEKLNKIELLINHICSIRTKKEFSNKILSFETKESFLDFIKKGKTIFYFRINSIMNDEPDMKLFKLDVTGINKEIMLNI